jgi:hypothetical protein
MNLLRKIQSIHFIMKLNILPPPPPPPAPPPPGIIFDLIINY